MGAGEQQDARARLGRLWLPIRILLFLVVTLLVLYPDPRLLIRHLRHVRDAKALADPASPCLAPMLSRFDAFMVSRQVRTSDPAAVVRAVQEFVRLAIPYAYDWEVWRVADYLPTLEEVIAAGREDCDGRAVVAAALLRARGINAELVADLRHVWVRTAYGDTMSPTGAPVFHREAGRLRVRWPALLDPGPVAFGIAVFPLSRELMIVTAAWLLLLPRRMGRLASWAALVLLVESLIMLRLSGADPAAPRYWGIAWAGLHVALAAVLGARAVAARGYRSAHLERAQS